MPNAIGIGVAAVAITLTGCGQTRAEEGGPTVQRSYQVGAFERIEVAGPYDVEVRTGAAPGVSASGPEKLIERLVVEVKGDRLFIHPRRENSMWRGWSSHGTARIQVTTQALRGAAIAGSGGMKVDQVRGASFEGSVAGSGDLEVGSIEVESLKLSIAGSGDVRARSGQSRNAEYSIAGSGDIDARGVQSESASVSITGSGSINGEAVGTADVSIMGSGSVVLTGGAKCSISKAGSGDARCS